MSLDLNSVFKVVGPDLPIEGLWRVLWKCRQRDAIYVISIPLWAADEPPPRYLKGPREIELSVCEQWLAENLIAHTQLQCHPLMLMSDEQIRQRYPARRRPGEEEVPPGRECAALRTRDAHWSLAEDICEFIEEHKAEAYELRDYGREVRKKAKQLKCRAAAVYNAVHCVMAYAAGKNSLLPAFDRSGAKGQQRNPKAGGRLGRKSAAFKAKEVESAGISLTTEDKQRISMSHQRLLKEGHSEEEAYLIICGTWWSSGSVIENGKEVPTLLPATQRPTRRQVRYWGPRTEDGKSAYELLLKRGEWEQKFRAMLGSSFDGLIGIGQVGVMDATGTHVALVAMDNRLEAIGTAHRIIVNDGLSECITGFYCGLEEPSERTADLAVVMSAIDKVEVFESFGITITSDQVPSCYYRKFRVDNGEGRTKGFIAKTIASGAAIEFVEVFRPERKQQVEGGHKVVHGILDNCLDGATRGRARGRGETHSALRACWTWHEYMCELLRAIVYFNCVADATSVMSRHPYRTEMLRDGVPPTRAAIFKWCRENNRVAIPGHDVQQIQARLLPTFKAVVKQTGVYLIRPDRGDKVELVVGPRYVGMRGRELRWHEGVRNDFHIRVQLDPNFPNTCWYVDELGMHRFDNVSSDLVAKREATLADYLAMQDRQVIQRTVAQTSTDQAKSDFVSHRTNANVEHRQEKQAAIKAAPGKVTKTQLIGDIRANREKEAEALQGMLDPVKRTPKRAAAPADAAEEAAKREDGPAQCPPPPPHNSAPVVHSEAPATADAPSDGVVIDALAAFRSNRRRA